MRFFLFLMWAVILAGIIVSCRLILALEREVRRQYCALREELAVGRKELEAVTRRLTEDSGRASEEQVPAAMLEGFDNLMRYTEKTAQGERT